MKQSIAIFFILMFSLRPSYYVGQLAYYELNIDTIIQKYCVNKDKPQMQCNGKCHLAKQLQLTEGNDKQKAVSIVFEAFFPVFLQAQPCIDFQKITLNIPSKASFYYPNAYHLQLTYALYRPPIC